MAQIRRETYSTAKPIDWEIDRYSDSPRKFYPFGADDDGVANAVPDDYAEYDWQFRAWRGDEYDSPILTSEGDGATVVKVRDDVEKTVTFWITRAEAANLDFDDISYEVRQLAPATEDLPEGISKPLFAGALTPKAPGVK